MTAASNAFALCLDLGNALIDGNANVARTSDDPVCHEEAQFSQMNQNSMSRVEDQAGDDYKMVIVEKCQGSGFSRRSSSVSTLCMCSSSSSYVANFAPRRRQESAIPLKKENDVLSIKLRSNRRNLLRREISSNRHNRCLPKYTYQFLSYYTCRLPFSFG